MPKKSRAKGKAGGQSEESVAPISNDPGDIVDRALAKLSGTDGDTMELAKDTILESLPELQEGYHQQNLTAALRDMLEGVGVNATDDEIDGVAQGLKSFHLGMGNPLVTFDTTLGSFTVEVFLDTMPLTASNFLDLVQNKFYNGLHVHRIVDGFMVQLGCPHSADPKAPNVGEGAPAPGSVFSVLPRGAASLSDAGTATTRGTEGDQAGCIQDEHDAARISNTVGTLAMANNDAPHTGGSQFFINTADNAQLDFWDDSESTSQHPVFGKVVGGPTGAGMAVVVKMEQCQLDADERPIKPIKIKSAVLA